MQLIWDQQESPLFSITSLSQAVSIHQRGRENTSRCCKARVGKDKTDNSGCHRDESTLKEMDEQYEHQKMF